MTKAALYLQDTTIPPSEHQSNDKYDNTKSAVGGAGKSTHFASVDGLRAFACLWVLCYHALVAGGNYDWLSFNLGHLHISYCTLVLRFGFLGVDVFFLLSAFCLSYPLLRSPQRPFHWREYLLRRCRRIAPAYYCAFAIFFLLSLVVTHFRIQPFFSTTLWNTVPLRQLIYGLLFINAEFNGSFWTLCVEARWYLVLPLFIVLLRRSSLPMLLAVCFVLAIICDVLAYNQERAKWISIISILILSPGAPYLFTFGLGISIAAFITRVQSSSIQRFLTKYCRYGLLGAIVLIEFWQPSQSAWAYERLICGAVFSFFALMFALFDPFGKKLLSFKPLVAIGMASYSIYLMHLPIIELVSGNYSGYFRFGFGVL